MHKSEYDVIVIGAGITGLSLACYLQKAGLETAILERRLEFGGACSSEEKTIPGFYHNLHSNFHLSIPWLPVYRDFELESLGVKYYLPEANIGMPLQDGRTLIFYTDDERTIKEIGKFSKHDAKAWPDFRNCLDNYKKLLMSFVQDPSSVDTDPGAVSQEILDYVGFEPMGHSALEIINGIFENDHVRALLLFHISICGFDVADKAPNYQPIWFLANLTNWHLCRGGSHYLTHAAGGAFLRMGGELIEQAHVSKINIEDGKAAGVELQDGRKIRARKAVVSSVDLEQTFIDMIDAEHLDTELTDKVKAFRYDACNNVLFGGHVALKEPARYLAAKDNPDIDRCFNMNVGYETPADIIEHIDEVKANELPKTPRLNAGCNTLFDPTQAPPGYHTGVLWQFVPFNVDDKPGEYWLDIQEEYLDRCLHEWAKYAPNMQGDNILGRYVHSPWHIDRMLINMRGGNFNVGSTMASQAGDDRPMPELSGYDTPIDQLYLCGSCCKDQGGITGLTPWGALLRIAEDLDLKEKLGLR